MVEVDLSIVAANYNNGSFLKQFFQSINESSCYPKEIIFVDDCSSDNSVEIIRSLEVKNLQLVKLEKNIGFSNALNIGIEQATRKYILRIDPDDYMDRERIRMQYEFMEAHPEIDILGSNCVYFNDESGNITGKSNVKLSHEEIKKRFENGEHGIIHGTIICKAEVLRQVKYLQQNYPAEEYDIFCRMLLSGFKFHNLPEALLIYRIHGKSISNKMPFNTVSKIFYLKEQYFGKKTSRFKIYRMFLFLRNYRNFLEAKSKLKQLIFISVCLLAKPESVLNRISKFLKN